MFLTAMSRWEIAQYQCTVPHIVVSITDPDDVEAVLPVNHKRLDVLRVAFADVEDHGLWSEQAITHKQAKQIVDFFMKYKDQIESCIVHCEAGVSRSAGCASALSVIAGEDDSKFVKGRYVPNRTVCMRILNAAGMTIKAAMERRMREKDLGQ